MTEVYPSVAELRAAASDFLNELAELAPLAMRADKQIVHDHFVRGHGLDPTRDAMIACFLFRTHDVEEGIRAFKYKRPAMFGGR